MAPLNRNSGRSFSSQVSIWVLLLTNLLVFQLGYNGRHNDIDDLVRTLSTMTFESQEASVPESAETEAKPESTSSSTSSSSSESVANIPEYALALPQGKAKNLPSVRIESTRPDTGPLTDGTTNITATGADSVRSLYGGQGDKAHLGGFTEIDIQGISPGAWSWMVRTMGVKSMMDVGCGRGISTSWFAMHNVEALCIEGSHDAREKTVLPDPDTQMVEHDFSRGPWWPEKTYDAIWCVEFLEHVGRNFHKHYLPTFRKAALIFATHSNWGGWHHVEVHKDDWWILKFELYGFKYSPELTRMIRTVASNEKNKYKVPNGKDVNAQHVWLTMMVFINPAVAALPQHHHLVYEPGCYHSRKDGNIIHRDCATEGKEDVETPLPDEYKPINITPQQDQEWFDWIKARVPQYQPPAGK